MLDTVGVSSNDLLFQGLDMAVHSHGALSSNSLILKDNFLSAPIYKHATLLLPPATLSWALEVSMPRLFPQFLPTLPIVTLDLMIINYMPWKNFFYCVAD